MTTDATVAELIVLGEKLLDDMLQIAELVQRLKADNADLRTEIGRLRAENARLRGDS